MKLTLLCHDIPYPANHGGRVDMWRRIKALHHFGVELHIVCWCWDQDPTPADVAVIAQYAQRLWIVPIRRTLVARLGRMLRSLTCPPAILSRVIPAPLRREIIEATAAFKPDAIVLDGIHGGAIAYELNAKLNIPIVTRSHNIEHLYYRRLLASSSGLEWLRKYLSLVTLERYEKAALRHSLLFYDISADDLKFWHSQGLTNGRYLPPIIEFSSESKNALEAVDSPQYDIVFLGNLFSPNNVEGVKWFLTQVVPIVKSKRPATTVLIAGLHPTEEIQKLCQIKGIDLKANPPSSTAIYQSGRVLINPISSGSGVSLKSIEMLSIGRPIVSTTQGLAGLPNSVKDAFQVADDAPTFATLILTQLASSEIPRLDRMALESLFGYQVIERFLSELKSTLSPAL